MPYNPLKYTWTADTFKKDYPKLSGNISADVIIIGGGLTGVWSAYLLSQSGKKVVLLEEKGLGRGATHETTAFITEYPDTDASDLIKIYGKEQAIKIYESLGEGVSLIKKTVQKENIDCEFASCSNFIFAANSEEGKDLKREFKTLLSLGRKVVLKSGQEAGFHNFGMIEYADQGMYHPLKFLFGLAERTQALGAQIYEKSAALRMHKDGNTFIVETKDGKVSAPFVISATYAPFKQPLALFFKKACYVSYVMEIALPAGKIPAGIYEDMKNPYHYFRVEKRQGEDRMILGGEDHRSDIKVPPRKNFKALTEFFESTFGFAPVVRRRWSGPIMESVDGLPFIGSIGREENILYATGFSGNGMVYAPLAARIFSDFISKKESPYANFYRADRHPKLRALAIKGRDFGGELIHGAIRNLFR